MNRGARFIAKACLILVAVAALGAIVTGLWNWVMPALFSGAHPIDYAHALGLLVLCRLLFGGFSRHGGWHGRWHGRWARMTPEQRAAFRRGLRESHARGDLQGASEK
jgi:hypothetical protein